MGTSIRPEVSNKNKYWIDRHRYYELKHFCLQYPSWKKIYISLDGYSRKPLNPLIFVKPTNIGDPTAACAEARIFYSERLKLLERVAEETDSVLGKYVLKGVTEGLSYEHLRVRTDVPCCKDTYYELYRRFFWLLSQARG